MIGRTISHYRIEEKLGEGGMGVVYKARDAHLDRPVAIKVLPPERVADAERKRRFVQEAKAASALNHPNIITIYDIDSFEGADFIAMEYVAGQSLDRLIGHQGLALREALRCAIQIADALAAAHEGGIVHRDLKPGNVMVTEKGQVKLLDFGLAKLAEPLESDELAATQSMRPKTVEGAILGTVAYMSPEQAEGKKVDRRSDIFSFGSVLYEMVTGRRAFQGETRVSTLAAILHQEPKPVSEVAETVPRELEKIIRRCLRKERDRRLQDMADVKNLLEELKEESESGAVSASPVTRQPARSGWAWATVGVLAVAAGAGWWWKTRQQPAPERPVLTRLTSDSGLTTNPALSPDGKLLAFASDRSGEGHLDIWVRQVAGGEPLRLTRQSGDESEPSFSPDGTQIAFRSEADGGGVYVVPALGGEPRLLAREGRGPRFSPDGKWVAYWTGERSLPLSYVYLISATGGTPRKLDFRPALLTAKYPRWSPDGQTLLLLGNQMNDASSLDWWTASVESSQAAATGAFEGLRRQQLPTSMFTIPGDWREGRVLFSARQGDSTSLWEVSLSPATGRVSGAARQVTLGTGVDTSPSLAADGQLVFASLAENVDIWSLPLDAAQGKPRGELQRLTRDAALDVYPSVTEDGKRMVFRSDRSGSPDIWMMDLESGRETRLTVDPGTEDAPLIAADHSRISYRSGGVHYVITAGPRGYAGPGEKLCENCGTRSDIASDGSRALHARTKIGGPASVFTVDIPSGQQQMLARTDKLFPSDLRFSPDGRWIAFHAFHGIELPRRQIFISPVRPEAPTGESEFIAVTDGTAIDRFVSFSPDGNLLYFISERDGFRCLAAQRLDPATKRPSGPMLYVQHFHGAQRSMMNFEQTSWCRFSVARDKVVFSLLERTGNIWMTKLPKQ
jgi:serine/threonine protein kinase